MNKNSDKYIDTFWSSEFEDNMETSNPWTFGESFRHCVIILKENTKPPAENHG